MSNSVKKTCQFKACGKSFERPASYAKHSALDYCSRDCYMKDKFGRTQRELTARDAKIDAMSRGGWKDARIAREFGISRQRVATILKTIEKRRAESAA